MIRQLLSRLIELQKLNYCLLFKRKLLFQLHIVKLQLHCKSTLCKAFVFRWDDVRCIMQRTNCL